MLIKLNDEQEEVVKDRENNILLTAIPGSGKTRTIVYKIIEDLKTTTDNRLIVGITYTNRAAEEMLERIEKEVDETERLFIGTIHSFCYEYIFKRNIDKTDNFYKGFKIISPEYEQELIRTIADTKALSAEEKKIINFSNLDTTINIDGSYNETNEMFLEIITELYAKLTEQNLLNFNSLLYESYKILRNYPYVTRNLKGAINCFYIDEYQDTHQIQYDILSVIYKSEGNPTQQLIFVGDENQAIYTSLGSVIKNKDELNSQFLTSFIHKELNGCYRSSQTIIDYYKNFAVNNIEMNSRASEIENPIIQHYILSSDQTYTKVAELINSFLENGIKESEICIMAPWWYLLVPISQKLRDLLPTRKFDAPEITPIKRNEDQPLYKLSKIICMKISHENINYKRRLSKELNIMFKDFYGVELSYNCDELLTVIEKRRENTNELSGTEYLKNEMEYILFSFLKVKSSIVRNDLEIFLDEVSKRISNPKFKLTNTIETFLSMFGRKDGIVISTCHGVKGEEYDIVICLNVNEGKIPHFSTPENRDEAKRLLFVMFSRARKEIHVFSNKDNQYDFPTRELIPFFYHN